MIASITIDQGAEHAKTVPLRQEGGRPVRIGPSNSTEMYAEGGFLDSIIQVWQTSGLQQPLFQRMRGSPHMIPARS